MADNINQLDAMEKFLRRGKLEICPEELKIRIALTLNVPNPDYKQAGSGVRRTYEANLAYQVLPLDKLSTYSTGDEVVENNGPDTKYPIDLRRFKISITKIGPRYPAADLLQYTSTGSYVNKPHESNCYTLLSEGMHVRSGLNPKHFPIYDWMRELHTSKTLKEWRLWARDVRKHVRRLMIQGTLSATLRRADYLKTSKDHSAMVEDFKAMSAELLQAIGPVETLTCGISHNLEPFTKVAPYEGWRRQMRSIYHALATLRRVATTLHDSMEAGGR